ncbi:MAG: indolepyruvate ferredoxin oxidoreductase [Solirubrobacteraceae bacterium]|nr:indolepyruvate ferredoxin oxidoreductase [Solirubrobacteraceae bacterium]
MALEVPHRPAPTGSPARRAPHAVTLDDKYTLDEGLVYLSGVQALVRVALDQMRADRAAGLSTGTMISGYQGSPLGGYDRELQRVRQLLAELEIHHQPALNEELGATSVWGSQLAPRLPKPSVEGVVGWWYGKAPGVDRAADALRHGNFVGASPKGGMVALAGDDPASKSSTLPSATEATLASIGMPVLYPGSVQETLDLGRHAVALSRASGLWTALKVVTSVADAAGTASVGLDRVRPVMPIVEYDGGPYVHEPDASLLAPASVEMERTLRGPRLELARAYARQNGLNRVALDSPGARLGIVAAGTTYHDLREALRTLGVDHGIRVLHIQMLWPLETGVVRDFARGLDEIVVLEEKGPFLATAVREALYDLSERPAVNADFTSVLEPDAIARIVGDRLVARGQAGDSVRARLEYLDRIAPQAVAGSPIRTPFFCSGCPHNRSTEAPDDASVGLGIGCHTMVLINQVGKGKVTGLTQMGGEGAQWIGQSPFTEKAHIFQNLGDGTFHHSGSLAVRAAVAAGINITYKLLYNSAVAMTGGQDVEGGMTVPELTRWLELEGVKRIIVTTDEPQRYKGVSLSAIAEVRDRAELLPTQRELAKVEGVTVLIHDQMCATEKRRAIKRGKLPKPTTRVAINERVCEGCGDCGQKSKCLSVLPVQTEFGRKTQIHQASCNSDLSCLDGDCPSFLEVTPGKRTKPAVPAVPVALPDPVVTPGEKTIRMIGIGGTGVVTMAQIVGMAALMDGKQVHGLDQTGLAQKGGPVVSDLRILEHDDEGSNRAVAGGVDAYLGFDLLGATSPANLFTADPDRTVAVVSTHRTPTGAMIVDPTVEFAALSDSLDVIDRHVHEGIYLDPQALSEALFGDHMPSNSLLLGAAWQRGLIPLSLESIEAAIRLNGAAVDATIAAFHWGRATVAAPDAVEDATRVELPEVAVSDAAREIVDAVGATGELRALLERRVEELIAYQDRSYAIDYAEFVAGVRRREPDGRTSLAEAVARHLFKLMAYKDEYEVARLHLDPTERARLEAEFGEGAKISYKLHPPVLRALGMQRKLTVGPRSGNVTFRMLRRMKRLRGTKLDPFGHAKVRRVERALPDAYRAVIERGLERAGAADYATLVELCELPDMIRGYEDIKLAGVERFHARAAELLEALESGPALRVIGPK